MQIPFRLAANLWKLQRVKFRRTEISYDCVVSEGYWTRTKESSKRALSRKRALSLRILVGRLREVWLYNEHSQNRHCPETCLYNQVTVSYRPSVKSSRLQNSRFPFFAKNRFCKESYSIWKYINFMLWNKEMTLRYHYAHTGLGFRLRGSLIFQGFSQVLKLGI